MNSLRHHWTRPSIAVLALAAAAACSTRGASTSTPTGATTAASTETVTPTGVIDTVTLTTDNVGNYFKPNSLTVHRGDMIRFMLNMGVHNVDFLADSNPGKVGLPAPSVALQLPGQTLDVPVTFAPGTYYFQCDPHAALGMRGHLVVLK